MLSRLKEVFWPSLEECSTKSLSDTTDDQKKSLLASDGKVLHQRFFTGVVTSVTEDSGMIDNYVFFDMGVVLGGVKVEVEDMVYVEAERKHVKAGWTAVRVEVISAWVPSGESDVEVIVGYVSGLGGRRGVVTSEEKEVSFPLDMAPSVEGYRPHVNDWVKLFLLHQDNEITVNELRPLRELSLAGVEVTHVARGYGTVRNDIYFALSVCSQGYYPSRGDVVDVECVEYRHDKNNWRAYRITPQANSSFADTCGKGSPSFPRPAIPLLSSHGRVVLAADISPTSAATPTSFVDSVVVPPCPDSARAPRASVAPALQGSYRDKVGACRVPGQRPIRKYGVQKLSTQLRQYCVPQNLRECMEEGSVEDVMSVEPSLEEPLCMENYRARFQALLYLEELQREKEIRQFDMASVCLRRAGPYLNLKVPGLTEGRPSLLVGDRAILCEEGADEVAVHWEGYIHEVRNGEILLKFADHFHETFNEQKYDVMFTFSRMQFRRMHSTVEQCRLIGQEVLFPWQPAIHPPRASPRRWFNPDLNPYQRAAVMRILGGQCMPSPYIVFGPPGTGKTVTLVEAILQVVALVKGSRVLVCAPSNSAADLLAERLCLTGKLSPVDLTRLNAIQRPLTMPPPILRHCKDTDSADSAVRSRIVVATCSTAGYLSCLGLGVGHFTHVFVDEAGQAMETECLLPVALLAGSTGRVVLAGDPYQLGPVLSSHLAGGCGLGLSFLERLMERQAYQRSEAKFGDHGNYDPLLVTKLVHNYRSHSHLLQLYSDLFYHGELQVHAPHTKTHLLLEWEGLPKKGFPLIVHGVVGQDMQEGNSPSWFNPVEALQVVKYIQALKDNATFAPRLSELAVVTPYRKQVEKIRHMLHQLGCGGGGGALAGVKVGSVEEFQGQERTAIIISTVRSSADLVDQDTRHHLGFLSNPKRFNVAISRACALLVVVGNPSLLAKDMYWNELLQYALRNGAYIGCAWEGLDSH